MIEYQKAACGEADEKDARRHHYGGVIEETCMWWETRYTTWAHGVAGVCREREEVA
jgi:hypothetical protein